MANIHIEDADMTWNDDDKRYILKESYVLNELLIDLSVELDTTRASNPVKVPKKFLNKVSKALYNFIALNCRDEMSAKYVIAVDIKFNRMIKQALESLLVYWLRNGNLGEYSRVNLETSTMSNMTIEDTMGVEVIGILMGSGLIGGKGLKVSYIPGGEW